MAKENKVTETKDAPKIEAKKVEPKVAVLTTKIGEKASDGCTLLRREKSPAGATLDMWQSKGGQKLIIGIPHTDLSGTVIQKFPAKERAEADAFFDTRLKSLKPEAPKAEKTEKTEAVKA